MIRKSFGLAALSATVALFATPALARDFFVRAGSSGDGTQGSPFGDPWEALEKVEAGDKVHVAEGKYYGRQDVGVWKIPYPRVELLGGYDRDFKARDPWKNRSELLWKKGSKNKTIMDSRVSGSNADHSGVVVDGFVIDMADQNKYVDGTLQEPFQPTPIELQHPGSVIRNNVILNASWDAVRIRQGVTVENNLILNAVNWGINLVGGNTLSGNTSTAPAQIRGNTVAFAWDKDKPGAGGYGGSCLAIAAPVVIEGNVLANCDNHGIYMVRVKPEKVTLKNNTFFMNLFSNLKFYDEGAADIAIDDKEMDSLEEVGLKSSDGNVVADPGLPLDKAWMEKFSSRTAAVPGKLVMDDWNKYRQTLGLPLIAKGGEGYSGFAPPWEPDAALKLLAPKNGKAGARTKALTVGPFSAAPVAAVAKDYKKSELMGWVKSAEPVDKQALEIVAGVGGVTNTDALKEELKDAYAATWLYDPAGSGGRVYGYYAKGTSAARLIENAKYYSGSGKPPTLFVVRGTARYLAKNYPKSGFVIDSIEEKEEAGVASGPRPKGRDWFVKQDAKGGDGSKEKPFKDPYQALERMEAGDTIHVAGGEYNGKLKTGRWKIDMPYIALLGGYSADFSERDPWKYPTQLKWPAGAKTRNGGYILEGEGDHTGAIVDGFVFDRKDLNRYGATGDIMVMESDKTESVWLFSPGSTIRNCVFVNGAQGAIRMSTANVIENNIFMNHVWQNIAVTRHNDETPVQIRNNTILFAWNKKFGEGGTTTGSAVRLETGAKGVIDSNIIQFMDNQALVVNADPRDVVITNNVFSHNLFSNYWHDRTVIDDSTMHQFKDTGLKGHTGNVVMNPNLPIDPKWFETYLNRTAYVPGKVTMDDWNNVRELMGQPLLATGGSAGSGFAPAYDWKKAMELFPKDPKVKAGARKVALPVKFDGIKREEAVYSYEDTDWPTISKNAGTLEGKRVQLKVALGEWDNAKFEQSDLSPSEWAVVKYVGPEGAEAVGLPKRAYIKKGTRFERVVKAAPGYRSPGKTPEVHWLRGVVRKNGDLVADQVEKVDE